MRHEQPRARKLAIPESDNTLRGLPNRFPFARAFRTPAFTRSTIRLRSSSATAPRTVNTSLPAGVAVSIASLTETKLMPSEPNVSSARSRWDTDRAKRWNRQHATTSNRRRCASAIRRSSCGRFSLVARDSDVHVLPGELPATTLTIFTQLTKLNRPECQQKRAGVSTPI
jgi:hypothetical protein